MAATRNDAAFNHDLDVEVVADFFIQQDALRLEPDVTPMKLQKLLYFAQANYLASTGERLFDEPVEAFQHGPVVHRAWQLFPGSQIIAAADTGTRYASRSDERVPADVEEFLGAVWLKYKNFSASALRGMTHRELPWKNNYVENSYRPEIPDEEMTSYYRQCVAASDRVFHSAVVVIPDGFIEDMDEDDIAAKLASFMTS